MDAFGDTLGRRSASQQARLALLTLVILNAMETIGVVIRSLRTARGMTLRDLAKTSGVSTSFLSQAERGLCSVSIPTLGRISAALGVSLHEIFAQADSGQQSVGPFPTVLRADDQHAVSLSDAAIKYRFLSREVPGRLFEVVIGEIPVGYEYPRASHDGEEFGYLLDGELRLLLEDGEHTLHPGDSYHLGPYASHGYEALGDGPVRLLWVQTVKDLKIRTGTPKPLTEDGFGKRR